MFAKQPQPKNDLFVAKCSGKPARLQLARQFVAWGLAVSLTGAMPLEAGLGYLPAIGPSPLRFQTPTVAYDRASLPLLDMGDAPVQVAKVEEATAVVAPVTEPIKNEATVDPSNAAALATRTNQAPVVVAQNPPPSTSTNQPAATPLPTFGSPDSKDPSVMSPQMLIHFFRPSNAGGTKGG